MPVPVPVPGPGPGPGSWRLAPGLRVVRRGRARWQVGLDPDRRVLLPDDAGTRRLLDALSQGVAGEHPVLERLLELGLVEPAEPVAPPPRVRVSTPAEQAPWAVDVHELLAGARLRTVASRPDAVLVLCHGEPDRADLDPLVRDGTDHLVLTLSDGGARLGPLVEPGRTACLRCVDVHRSTDDPDHVAVLTRYAAAQHWPGADPHASAGETDPALVALATGWAVRDLARHLHGRRPRPSSWSSTLTWHPHTDTPVPRRWLRHPDCGCGWAAYDDPWSGTMEA